MADEKEVLTKDKGHGLGAFLIYAEARRDFKREI